ncbi:hypothetical protein FUMI01_20860 [Flavobacterium sp. UMI-01]|nr:hypothetical protein FUMI01_20860 [Flavobacterium sp. UMI-01]
MVAMDFLLSPKERAQKYWDGFLYKTLIECERQFTWLAFTIKGKSLVGKGTLEREDRKYHFSLECSPFNPGRMERIWVETPHLIKSFDIHFNGDGSLCLYHPILDLKGRPYIDLVDVLPWISEWIDYYELYLKYKVWLGPEHPHYIK